MQDHYSAVTSLSLVPEGNLLLTAGRDKVANLWDLATHKKLATIPVFEAIEGERCTWLATAPILLQKVFMSRGAAGFAIYPC